MNTSKQLENAIKDVKQYIYELNKWNMNEKIRKLREQIGEEEKKSQIASTILKNLSMILR